MIMLPTIKKQQQFRLIFMTLYASTYMKHFSIVCIKSDIYITSIIPLLLTCRPDHFPLQITLDNAKQNKLTSPDTMFLMEIFTFIYIAIPVQGCYTQDIH